MTQHPNAKRDFPHWLRDIDANLPINAAFIVHGNIRDHHLIPDGAGYRFAPTTRALWELMAQAGYEAMFVYDPVAGLSVLPADRTAGEVVTALGGRWSERVGRPCSPETLAELVHTVQAPRPARPVALVLDYVSQFQPAGEPLTTELHALFRAALYRATASGKLPRSELERAPLYNPVFWIVDRPSDLPGWMVASVDGIHQVPIPNPDLDTRLAAGEQIARGQSASTGFGPMTDADVETLVTQTEGMTLRAMREVIALARDQRMRASEIGDAIRMYRVGLLENPWQQGALKQKIRTADVHLSSRVLGQPAAIRRSLDILMRSTTGLTAAHAGGRASGPRGVLFFAGPTGVGKTELAKALTEVVFGDPNAYIRFDMSEFAHEGSDLRLMGSPPGYIGHEAGGELTNAIRQKPFSLVLFDEIEKADQKIMDKFLQILSDGRLTDGSGATVHFSEALIVFTSNKGMADVMPDGSLPHPAVSYGDLDSHVRKAITRHFTETLGRPEILNRIGDNIVVFDYIRPDVAARLFAVFLENTISRVKELHGIDVYIGDEARVALSAVCCSRLDMGGRGIGQMVESAFTNPLAREVFFHDDPARPIKIDAIEKDGGTWTFQLA
ncbi:AAA family ATPase [Gordonia sp. NPDC062954]|uniref:AAA family ATPase n=1 Tax=Gordonia sp. NPDC062954 TaxID=3364003 RepID=UPI0037C51963